MKKPLRVTLTLAFGALVVLAVALWPRASNPVPALLTIAPVAVTNDVTGRKRVIFRVNNGHEFPVWFRLCSTGQLSRFTQEDFRPGGYVLNFPDVAGVPVLQPNKPWTISVITADNDQKARVRFEYGQSPPPRGLRHGMELLQQTAAGRPDGLLG